MNYYEICILGLNLKALTYHFDDILEPFTVVSVQISNKIKTGFVLKSVSKPDFKTKSIVEILDRHFTPFQIELAKFMSHYYICPIAITLNSFEPLAIKSKNIQNPCNFTHSPNLNANQTLAYEFANSHQSSLIFGDTGSGKSEIYIKILIDTLSTGKQGLFLMPEISLTPQMQKRLKEYFGDLVEIWHSKISPKKKSEILEKLQNGEVRLIAGARSALMLPYTDLGAIIIDEEHDDSYKASNKPRYNARDAALFISKKLNIRCVLGSATPSLTSYTKQPSFRLKGTFFESQKNFIYDESDAGVSPTIINELQKSLDSNRQAIVFVPTRANFKYMVCYKCGEIIKCPFCSVGMSLHKDKNLLRCHYCGYATSARISCPKCQNSAMENKKIGTSEVVSKLQKIFPTHTIAKFDRDEITTQKKLLNLLKNFNDKKIDILVGTQMLSKGHDYHNVDLAVIIGLDEHLAYADFRAREKTLSTAMQIAGRAGRAGLGRVLIQTRQSEFFRAYIDDYERFLKDEIVFREELYPPFMRILRLLISSKDENLAIKTMNDALKILNNFKNIEIIGHGKATIEYIAGKFRYDILIRSNSHKALIKAAAACQMPNLEIDMDAINFT
ncbi:MAG: primosomal protein N' [Campylobacter sp.]|nr:primosomal protein N' [Campylobacter sp.]